MKAHAVVTERSVSKEMQALMKKPILIEYLVDVYWDASVDRKCTGGWVVDSEKNARRLERCINDQKAFKVNGNGQGEIVTDINGKTYVNWQGLVWGKRLNADLKRLGY